MSVVGDVIMSARELMTDLPSTLGAPVISSVAAGSASSPGFAPGTYFFVATQINFWGESLQSNEGTITLAGPGTVLVLVSVTCSLAASAIRVYIGTAAGAEGTYQEFPVSGGTATLSLDNFTNRFAQSPPARSTAYLPDTDGRAVSAFAIFRWLNQGLAWAAAKNRGGVPDFGAVATVVGQPIYQLPGYWKKLDTAWYDGYPLYLARKNDVFRKSTVTGFVGALLVYQASDRLIVESWPQPSRTSAQTTLSAPMAATDTVANLTNTLSFVLNFGLVKIGTEIMEYAAIDGVNNRLTGLTRGMSGTTVAAQALGAQVNELNLMVSGLRVPSTYAVGCSLAGFNLPPGWDDALMSYLLYRFRSAEQDDRAAQRYLAEATQKMSDLSANRIIAGPRQIQANAGRGAEVMTGLGSPFGGVIVP